MTTTARRSRRADGELTRQRVLQAAVDSILEVGYYASSSNEIARRAGVTWGVIQHQFGTREALLLEVLQQGYDRLEATIAEAEITGTTLEDRLLELLGLLETHYGVPARLAGIQIGLDLSCNPATSEETREAVRRNGERVARAWRPLFVEALGECGTDRDLVRFAVNALRNHLVGGVIDRRFQAPPGEARQRQLLVQGIAASIRIEADRRGLTAP